MSRFTEVENRILKKYISDPQFSDSLNSIRRVMELIWANDKPTIVEDYTDHGVEHSQRIVGFIEKLLQVNPDAIFSQQEIYLLFAGIYLHDIGMQCDIVKYPAIKIKAEGLGAKFDEALTAKTTNGYSSKEQNEIRKNHHYLSAAWIDYLHQGNDSVLSPLIKSVPYGLVDDLMDVCKFHSKLPINDCSELFDGDPNSRKKMVASLLRFADELDINSRRVNIETVKIYSIDPENSIYWWLHNNIEVYLIGNKVLLKVNLHPENFKSYGSFLNEELITSFKIKNKPILDVLVEYKIPILIDEKSSIVSHNRVEKFPPEITAVLDKKIKKSDLSSDSLDKKLKVSMQVPQIKNFVGRNSELSNLHSLLENNILIIEGIAGIGKTYLASKFAAEIKDEYEVYWYENLSEFTVISSVMRQMAIFLNEKGKPTLYNSIENIGYDHDNLIDILRNELINGKFAIFFDNFHIASNVLNPLMKKLLDIQSSKIILITRIKPIFYNKLDEIESRIGQITIDSLDCEDSKDMFNSRGIIVSEEAILKEVHKRLHGHPQYLNLFCILALKSEPKELLEKLPKAEKDSYDYLEAEVYNSLISTEKALIKIASVYRIPETIDAFYITPDSPNVDETLDSLVSKFLINKVGDEKYSVHEIMSDYCLKDVKKKKIIKEYHRKAAQYYELKDKNPESLLEASYHYIEAGDNEESGHIIINNASNFIRKGFWEKIEAPLKNAIQTLNKRRHDLRAIKGVGYAHLFIGEFYTERGDLALALDQLDKSQKTFMRAGEQKALYQLNTLFGHLYSEMGEFDKAMNCYQKCLELSEDEYAKAVAKGNLANMYSNKGNYEKAIELHLESKISFKNNEDETNVAVAYENVGKCYSCLDDYDNAYVYMRKGIELFKNMGETYYLFKAYFSYIRISLNDPSEKEKAERILQCLDKILDTYKKMGYIRGEAKVYLYTALVYDRIKNYDLSIEYYQRARCCFDKVDYCNLSTQDKIFLSIIFMSLNDFDKAESILNDTVKSVSNANLLSPLLSLLLAICFLCQDQEPRAMKLIETDIKDCFQKNYRYGSFEFLPLYTLMSKQKNQKLDLIKDIIAFVRNKTKYPKINFDHVSIERDEIENYAEVFHPFIGYRTITKNDQSLKIIMSKLVSDEVQVDVDVGEVMGIERNTFLITLGYLYKKGHIIVSELSINTLRIELSPSTRSKLITHNTIS